MKDGSGGAILYKENFGLHTREIWMTKCSGFVILHGRKYITVKLSLHWVCTKYTADLRPDALITRSSHLKKYKTFDWFSERNGWNLFVPFLGLQISTRYLRAVFDTKSISVTDFQRQSERINIPEPHLLQDIYQMNILLVSPCLSIFMSLESKHLTLLV